MKGVFGGLLMAAGILIAGLSGLCTLLVVGGSLADTGSGGEVMSMVMAAGIFGGVPFVMGLGLFFAGRILIRSGRPAEVPQNRAPADVDGFARPRVDPESEPPPE